MSDAVKVSMASDADAADWDGYVAAAGGATFFHRFAWRDVIKSAYGYSPCYLMAKRGRRIAGVLPLIDVKSPLLGRNLISTAFTVGGGVAASDDAARAALAAAAEEEGRKRRVGYVELRSRAAAIDGWEIKNSVYAGFEREMPADRDEALATIPRKRRAELRKGLAALESGALHYRFTKEIEPFYRLYGYAMREHGTPVFSRRFAAALVDQFANDTEILVINAEGAPVLALLTFYFRDRVMPYYFAAGPEARAHRAFDLAVWLQMRRGLERGARIFDFGRSKYGAGSFDYKIYWGFEPRALEYQYKLIGARQTPNVNPDNLKFSAVSAAWRRLPLPLANLVGPMLARHLA